MRKKTKKEIKIEKLFKKRQVIADEFCNQIKKFDNVTPEVYAKYTKISDELNKLINT